MEALRAFTTRLLVILFAVLVVADCIDDMVFGNRWTGVPTEMYGLLGALIAGLYASTVVRRDGNGKTGVS